MAKIILACRQKPLAAFIESVFADLNVECRSVVDSAALTAAAVEFRPDIILINSGFPVPAENSVLLAELKDSGLEIPVLSICEPAENMVADVDGDKPPEIPDVLLLPFAEKELQKKIETLTGIVLSEKHDPETDSAEIAAVPAEDVQQNLQPEESEDETMEKVEAGTVKTFELTEIVEEGLPLDELPDRIADLSSMVSPAAVADASESVGDEPVVSQDVGEIPTDDTGLDFDDFGDSLDDLETDLQESGLPDSTQVETVLENDVAASLESVSEEAELADEDTVVPSAEMVAEEPKNDIELSPDPTEESVSEVPEPVAGDLDALLDDDDFAEVEIPEEEDPVLAGLKSVGLTPEEEVPLAVTEVVKEKENDPVVDDLNDYEDLLDGVAAARDEAGLESSADEIAAPAAESPVVGDAAEFVEMPRPEEVAAPELVAAAAPAAPAAAGGHVGEAEIELPEDYLEDEELMSGTSEIEPGIELPPEPEPAATPSPSRVSTTPSPAEPRVMTEPQSLDFSQQIEGMTQEWSKQLLQTTYASMDKMIKAIGDLAPTIVNQVAREVIPPLAEKVIKAEIARLEEQLKLEEGEEDAPQ